MGFMPLAICRWQLYDRHQRCHVKSGTKSTPSEARCCRRNCLLPLFFPGYSYSVAVRWHDCDADGAAGSGHQHVSDIETLTLTMSHVVRRGSKRQ